MQHVLLVTVLLFTALITVAAPATQATLPAAEGTVFVPLVLKSPGSTPTPSPTPTPTSGPTPGPSSNLPVSTASYLGGSGGDSANAVELAPDGSVVVAGAMPGYNPGGVAPVNLLGGGDGVVLRLNRAGTGVASVTRIGGLVNDMELDDSGRIVVCGDFGIAMLKADASALVWSASPGAVSRCAVGRDGTAAGLSGGTAFVYSPAGTLLKSWSVGGSAQNDIAVASAQGLVIATGFNQVSSNLQIPFIRAWTYDGALRWKSYDFPAGTPNLGSADTRGERIAIGRDGKLYFAGSINGGTGVSIFVRDPQDTSKTASARTVVTDKYTDPFNIGSVKMAWFGRFNPADGSLELAQSLLTRRTSDDKGNSISVSAISADEAGNVFLGGGASCCIKDRATLQVAGVTVGNYEGGEGYLLAVSSDFKTRLAWTPFAAPGVSAGASPVTGVAAREQRVALALTLAQPGSGGRGLITVNALQATAGTLPDAYFAVWPR